MTPEEREILQRLSAKAQRYQIGGKEEKDKEEGDEAFMEEVYVANMKLLQ